jgi:hypothetical protein
VSRGRNAIAIWQDMVSQYGFTGSYQTVKRFVRKLRGSKPPQAVGIIQTAPGHVNFAFYAVQNPGEITGEYSGPFRPLVAE